MPNLPSESLPAKDQINLPRQKGHLLHHQAPQMRLNPEEKPRFANIASKQPTCTSHKWKQS
eukprot:1964174-Prorocentrum_lima.AAC.1